MRFTRARSPTATGITPFQRSPQVDHGYDVSDYCDIDPLFGDLAAFDEMLRTAHGHRLRVIVNLVPNHCSSAHPLSQAALAAGPGSRERARFHFAADQGPDGAVPPNNWASMFGGPEWTRIREPDGSPGQWYLHLCAPEQPDWNWRDPRTAALFDEVVRFWFDRRVDGLRIDVAHGLFKAEGLSNLDTPATVQRMRLRDNPLACDHQEVHEVYRRWRALADAYSPRRVLIGEVNLAPARVARYTRLDELHQAFAFAFLGAPWDARAWQSIISGLLKFRVRGGAPVTWVVENHGVVIQDFEPLGKFDSFLTLGVQGDESVVNVLHIGQFHHAMNEIFIGRVERRLIWNILLQAQHGATGQPAQLGYELGRLVGSGELGDD